MEQFRGRQSTKHAPVRVSWILRKTLFLQGRINDFQPWGLPEIIKFAARNVDVKQSALKLEIYQFLVHFGLSNQPEKRYETEPVLRRYGTHKELSAN